MQTNLIWLAGSGTGFWMCVINLFIYYTLISSVRSLPSTFTFSAGASYSIIIVVCFSILIFRAKFLPVSVFQRHFFIPTVFWKQHYYINNSKIKSYISSSSISQLSLKWSKTVHFSLKDKDNSFYPFETFLISFKYFKDLNAHFNNELLQKLLLGEIRMQQKLLEITTNSFIYLLLHKYCRYIYS